MGDAFDYHHLLLQQRRMWNRTAIQVAVILAIIATCFFYVGLFDIKRLSEGIPSLFSLFGEMLPPNFNDVRNWIKPLIDTVAMSVAGTALAVAFFSASRFAGRA
ncbi:MAG: hypothetical protein QMD44_06060 [Thermodesulfovibrionales bacterium]|jgi:phosphonate transport system permease protein|nr:hypothetical protein [Thermodesulfovibrionales bacterium]